VCRDHGQQYYVLKTCCAEVNHLLNVECIGDRERREGIEPMTQHLELAVFVFFALITLGSALAMVLVEDMWHSALLMGVTLLSVAVHYVMLQAEFVAAMQVLVYVGGVLILISFAVMLTRRQTTPETATGGTTDDD
jgi:NADH-quinone oxidoreductase subunit J